MSTAAQLAAIVDRIDRADVELHAFVPEPGRTERLRDAAAGLAERWPDPAHRPPLYGVPLAVKDVFRTDGLPTRAGSNVPAEELAEELAGPEASAVTRLRAAGAVVVGKTVTAEFAYFAPGPTRNPHHPEYTPGGSSSGSRVVLSPGPSAAPRSACCAGASSSRTVRSWARSPAARTPASAVTTARKGGAPADISVAIDSRDGHRPVLPASAAGHT